MAASKYRGNPRPMLIVILALSILQGHLVKTNPAVHQQAKRQAAQPQKETSDGTLFLNGVGDLFSSIIVVGLRSAAAFMTSGTEAAQKVAVAVGSAALPPLFNVTRSFSRVQESSKNLFNTTQKAVPDTEEILGLTKRITEGIQPAVKSFSDALTQTRASAGTGILGVLGGGRLSSTNSTPQVNPFDSDIPDYID